MSLQPWGRQAKISYGGHKEHYIKHNFFDKLDFMKI